MTDIKDVLHLYLGQKIVVRHRNQPDYETTLTPAFLGDPTGVKLILRPLSSMTEEEKVELFRNIFPNDHAATPLGAEYCINYLLDLEEDYNLDKWMEDYREVINNYSAWSLITTYLLFKGFDLFGLHEKGLCLYEGDLVSNKQ